MKSNIQEQLRARRLKPSENSWEVLDARLEQDRKKGSGKKVIWLAAASIAALFVILITVFNTSPADSTMPKEKTVETTGDFKAPESNPVNSNSTNESELIAMPVKVEESPVEVLQEPKRTQPRIAKVIEQDKDVILVNSEKAPPQELPKEESLAISTEGIASLDVAKVTDDELDVLLKDAQVAMQMRKKREQRKADADWLLVEVEMELDQNFKDKVFDAIKNAVSNPKNTITKRDN